MQKTVLFSAHEALGARIVDFSGWAMPVQYPTGILQEHLATRRSAGLFDVSHMGRFGIAGSQAVPFLERVLTNRAGVLDVGRAHYTILADDRGAAVDDAYLYRFRAEEYLLVVNAGNRAKDWAWLSGCAADFDVCLSDRSDELAMVSVQGPDAARIVAGMLGRALPPEGRNALSRNTFGSVEVLTGRTGYAGEPVGFELMFAATAAQALWGELVAAGAHPVGLGARDTLRLEAGLPLYGHEFGPGPDGVDIPIFACPLAAFAVDLGPGRGDFAGAAALRAQHRVVAGLAEPGDVLPRRLRAFAVTGKGIPRAGDRVYLDGCPVGTVTSGTVAPYWIFEDRGGVRVPGSASDRRALGLALVDTGLPAGAALSVDVRGREVPVRLVPRHLDNRRGPYAVPVLHP